MKDNFIKNQKKHIKNDMLAIKDKGRTTLIGLMTILKFESDKNYTEIYLTNGGLVVSSRTLNLFEQILSQKSEFIRVNRSEIVNLHHAIYDNAILELNSKVKHPQIKISRRRESEVSKKIVDFTRISKTRYSKQFVLNLT